jgi:hypothetical protein
MELSRRRRNKYLGRRVRDTGLKGLDQPREYRGIIKAILEDARRGRISRKTAMGRLLLLYKLTYPEHNSKASRIPAGTRDRLRSEIKRAMRRL